MFFVSFIGIIGNVIFEVQKDLKPILTDVGNTFKVFVVYIGAEKLLYEQANKKKIIHCLAFIMKIFVLITFCFMLLHELHFVSMGDDMRYGLNSFEFINNGAGQLSFMFYSVILILTLELQYHKTKKLSVFIFMALIVWISTLRSRAFMYVAIYLFLYFTVIKRQEKIRLSFKNFIIGVGIVILFAMDQFETYFSNTSTARSNLLRYGLYTMKRFFPLGSGFATYGTDAAATYYSKLYVEYGFNYVYGLSRDRSMFAHDTYWPAIMAQFGFVGLICMIVLVIIMCSDMLKRSKCNDFVYLSGLFICVTQVSSSIATATFFHFVTVGLFFIVPLMLEKRNDLERKI